MLCCLYLSFLRMTIWYWIILDYALLCRLFLQLSAFLWCLQFFFFCFVFIFSIIYFSFFIVFMQFPPPFIHFAMSTALLQFMFRLLWWLDFMAVASANKKQVHKQQQNPEPVGGKTVCHAGFQETQFHSKLAGPPVLIIFL